MCFPPFEIVFQTSMYIPIQSLYQERETMNLDTAFEVTHIAANQDYSLHILR